MPAQPTEICENCTVRRVDLRRCAGCGVVRYCSKECQKAHWKSHKVDCLKNAELQKKAEALGPDYSEKLKAIGKWSDQLSIPIGAASMSALNVMGRRENIDEFVVIIYVEFLPNSKAPYTHDVVDAEVVPLDYLRAMALTSGERPLAQFESDLSPRPGMMRVLLLERTFPWSYTTPFTIPDEVSHWPRNPQWFSDLQAAVTRPGQPRPSASARRSPQYWVSGRASIKHPPVLPYYILGLDFAAYPTHLSQCIYTLQSYHCILDSSRRLLILTRSLVFVNTTLLSIFLIRSRLNTSTQRAAANRIYATVVSLLALGPRSPAVPSFVLLSVWQKHVLPSTIGPPSKERQALNFLPYPPVS
ncbi:hypothetical protein MSAN_01124800 [Mycena sanguinolenta]|uniref:MYND-type domain-containing protein n=1 Tax=Mycena sanguinolenta TaxID=230812 RepID=A0A8H6YKW7_9AGAR|nr:hypothetical protein MSAN_01124800 [Mycena sanguinolenta]